MDCPEFRLLLFLLRSDLKESAIPHRTKLRELVIESWREEFQVLKDDLAVLFLTPTIIYIFSAAYLECCRTDFLYNGYLVRPESSILYGNNRSLDCENQIYLFFTTEGCTYCISSSAGGP